jgi:hypothetical protein
LDVAAGSVEHASTGSPHWSTGWLYRTTWLTSMPCRNLFFVSVLTAATTRLAPRTVANCPARWPTPLAAAVTSTLSPGWSAARRGPPVCAPAGSDVALTAPLAQAL